MPSLDELLGRKSLKERIEALETERDRLDAQLDAEAERRRDAVRDRQDAEELINHLEDRIVGLEGELDRAADTDADRAWARVESIGPDRARDVVARLTTFRTAPEGGLSTAIDGEVPGDIGDVFGDQAVLVEDLERCLVFADDVGLIRVVLDVPRPPEPFVEWGDRFRLDPGWVVPDGPGTFAIVRSDLFALGTYEDGDLTFEEGFESDVMGRHSKGGFSQSRFERRRREQIDGHLDRCRDSLVRTEPTDLVLVGDRRMVGRLAEHATDTGVVDASGTPEDALTRAFRDFWTSRIYLP